MKLRSLLIVAPGALLLIAALAFVFVNKDDGHGHDHGHSHGDHDHSHGAASAAGHSHDHGTGAHSHGSAAASPPGELDHTAEWRGVFGQATLPQIWKSINAASDKTRAELERAELTAVPDLAETIHLGAHALYEQLDAIQKIGEADTQRLRAALAQLAHLADDVLDNAHHGDLARTRSAYARLASAIGVTTIRLPAALLDSATASPLPALTAKASAHPHKH